MNAQFITITEYCSLHDLDPAFLDNLEADGIITFTIIDNQACLRVEQLPALETFTRWYYELGLNTAGIDVVNRLLEKITALQDEIKMLNNKLSMYDYRNYP